MQCPRCQSLQTNECSERPELGYRRFRCRGCQREFNEHTDTPFNRLQYPSDIVCLVVLWRLRYKLSLRDLAELFVERGFVFTHETVRLWEASFAPLLTERLRKHRYGQGSRRWHVDETLIKVNNQWGYLYRALAHEGNLLDVRLSETCDLSAAWAFFRAARLITKRSPIRVTSRGESNPVIPNDARSGLYLSCLNNLRRSIEEGTHGNHGSTPTKANRKRSGRAL
jgi:transposase-like protein